MDLGKKIVAELDGGREVDTLTRWMAHYIAEVIAAAERATEPKEKRAKESAAAGLIARLWEHRSSYENRINPLHDLKPILQVLKSLDPNQPLWITNYGGPDGMAFRQVYDALRRIVLLMAFKKAGAITAAKSQTADHQNAEEQAIIAYLDVWLDNNQRKLMQEKQLPPSGSKKMEKPQESEKTNGDLVRELIAHARDGLDRLEQELLKQK